MRTQDTGHLDEQAIEVQSKDALAIFVTHRIIMVYHVLKFQRHQTIQQDKQHEHICLVLSNGGLGGVGSCFKGKLEEGETLFIMRFDLKQRLIFGYIIGNKLLKTHSDLISKFENKTRRASV